MAGDNNTPSASVGAIAWLRALRHSPRDAHEALALYVHALLLGHGFRDAEDDVAPDALRAGWGVGGYGGTYRHARSAMNFEVRATPLGARLRVTAVHDAADDVATLDLRVADYYDAEQDAADWVDRLRRVDDAATLVLVNIAHRLVPDATKAGYEQGAASSAASSSDTRGGGAAQPRPQPAPRPAPPVVHDDPLRIGPVRGGPRMPRIPVNPLVDPGFGSDDLLPQMPGGAPLFGPRGGAMGGNLMGPRNFHPGLGQPRRGGRLPAGVPPGARYDPMGPNEPDFDELLPPGTNPGPRPPGGGDDRPPHMYW